MQNNLQVNFSEVLLPLIEYNILHLSQNKLKVFSDSYIKIFTLFCYSVFRG